MKKAFLVLLISIPSFLLGYYFGIKPTPNNVAVLELSSARNDLKIYSEVSKFAEASDVVKTTIMESILKHILMVRIANPDINELKGKELETMCLLSKPEILKALNNIEPKQLKGVAQSYLASVRASSTEKIIEAQRSLGGKGCFLSPNRKL